MDEKQKHFLIQSAHECLLFSQHAINGYKNWKNESVSIQFMNQAFQCIKPAQAFYLQNFDARESFEFEQFFHQFTYLNCLFLESLEGDQSYELVITSLNNLEMMQFELKGQLMS